MVEVAFGPEHGSVRFGLRGPQREFEAGSSVMLEVVCENRGREPIHVFGFSNHYPRSLRVSPPKPHRPHVRVSFADASVLHPPEAFSTIAPGSYAVTGLDLSFVLDRLGPGTYPIAFGYDTVRAGGRLSALAAPAGVDFTTGVVDLVVSGARSLREQGIDAALEARLDAMLTGDDPAFREQLRRLGPGGLAYAARRVARVEASGVEAHAGFRALATLAMMGPAALDAVVEARAVMPHARAALDFADRWLRHRFGMPPDDADLPFVTSLDQLIHNPSMRGNFLLAWQPYDLPIHGTRRVDLLGSGDAVLATKPAGGSMPVTTRTMLTSAEMAGLLSMLRREGVWLFGPMRKLGLPDEPRPTLEIQLAIGEPFIRRIAAWNGEWRQGPAASLADALDRLFDPVTRPSLSGFRV